jgi:phosphoribosylformylglycinamidine (FGAM) synthase-like amidotransferase family enzyme
MKPEPKKISTENFILTVEFSNGQTRQIDIRKFFANDNAKVKEIKKSDSLFKTAKIEDGAAITWSNGFSLDPDVVYDDGVVIQPIKSTGVTKKLLSALKKIATNQYS